jgi:pimeloyl-ACP methyl ester carboxylesterase
MKKRNIAIVAIIVSLCLVFIGCTIMALDVYSQQFGRTEGFDENTYYTYITWKDMDQSKYPRQEVKFNSGENKLQGFIYGSSNNNGLVIISHGFGGTADHYFPMIMYFVDQGWRVFAYNNTGVGGSEGDSVRGLTQSAVDLDAALTYIENTVVFSDLPVMLVGHSWGGFAVCTVLNYSHKVNAVVSFAGFNIAQELFEEEGVGIVGGIFYVLTPQFWAIEKHLFGSAANLTAVGGINKSNIPVMIVQSSDDTVIKADTTSIYAHRTKITNPHVDIVLFDGENVTGHEYVYRSKAMEEYRETAQTDFEEYQARNQIEKATNADLAKWAEGYGFDKFKANELNPELMERINDLFINAKF